MLPKAGWVFLLCASTGNKCNWTLDFRMNVWCPSPKKSSVALHQCTTVHLVWARCRGVCLCKVYNSLWWISVTGTYCNSDAWIPLGKVLNIQAQGRGHFSKHTHSSQRGCVHLLLLSYWSGVGISSFAAQSPSSQDQGESKPGCLAICMLLWLPHEMTRQDVIA